MTGPSRISLQAIHLDPNSAEDYSSRARVWSDKSEYDEAIADFAAAIKLEPNASTHYYERGSLWLARDRWGKAIADYDEAIRLDPKVASSHAGRGTSWAWKGRHDKAITDYNEAIRLDPTQASAFLNRGIALSAVGQYDPAIKDYNEAIRLDPERRPSISQPRSPATSRSRILTRPSPTSTKPIQLEPTSAHHYNDRGIAWAMKEEYQRRHSRLSTGDQAQPKICVGTSQSQQDLA